MFKGKRVHVLVPVVLGFSVPVHTTTLTNIPRSFSTFKIFFASTQFYFTNSFLAVSVPSPTDTMMKSPCWPFRIGCFLVWLLGARHASGASANNNNNNNDDNVRREPRPNFILLFMDDLGYGDLGFTGHPTTKTPHLDRLAWNGKILTTWYSGCNICTGSRAALMTGRQFPRTGVPGVFGPTVTGGLNLNETTIAEHLKQAGYATAIVGKWHLGQRPVYLPGNQGFDYYLG